MSWSASIRAEIEAEFQALMRQPSEKDLASLGLHVLPRRAQGWTDTGMPMKLPIVHDCPPDGRRVAAVDLHTGIASLVVVSADDDLIYVVAHRASRRPHEIIDLAAAEATWTSQLVTASRAAVSLMREIPSSPAGKRAPKRVAAALPSVRLIGARQLTGDELPALLAALTVITRD